MATLKSIILDHPFLRSMSPKHADVLVAGAAEIKFDPGQIIFREGDPANQFYLILEGKIALESHLPHGEKILIQTIGSGDVLGWSWLFQPFMWHFQARALESTSAVYLNGAHLLVACEGDKELGYDLLRRLSQVLIQRLQSTCRQLMEARGAARSSTGPA